MEPSPKLRRAHDSSPPSPAATAADELASATLHETFREEHAAGNTGATYAAAGMRAGMPKQHVGELCDPLSGRRPKVATVIMLGPRLAARYFRKLASKLEERSRPGGGFLHAVLGAQMTTGRLAEVARRADDDGVIDDHEDAEIEAALCQMEADIAAVRAAKALKRRKAGVR